MNNATFTAFESGVLVTKSVNPALVAEADKVRALFGDVDFYWLWTAPNANAEEALYFFLDDERRFCLSIYADGTKPYFS